MKHKTKFKHLVFQIFRRYRNNNEKIQTGQQNYVVSIYFLIPIRTVIIQRQ